MKPQSSVLSPQSFRAFVVLVSLTLISFASSALALKLANKHVEVKIDAPTGISNFTGVAKGDDFYFFGKPDWPTSEFDVTYLVTLVDPAKCELVKPDPASATVKTKGGLITPYEVKFKADGEKKMGGKIYFIPVCVVEVAFSGANYTELKHYSGTPVYNAPHWRDENKDGDVDDDPHTLTEDRNFSVAFVSGEKMSVGAYFSAVGIPHSSGFEITANLDSTNGEKDLDKVECFDGANEIVLPITETQKPFTDSVQFYDRFNGDAFKATWTINFDNTSLEVGKTEHQIYVTLNKPFTGQLDPEATVENNYEDIFFHACKAPVEGLKVEAAIVDKIWEEFKDREVSRYELERGKADVDKANALGAPGMIYWKPGEEPCRTFPEFMREGHTSCGLWSKFFEECIAMHGITGGERSIEGKPVEAADMIQAVADYKAQFGFTGNVYYQGDADNNTPPNSGATEAEITEALEVGDRLLVVRKSTELGTEGVFYVKTTNITKKFVKLPLADNGFPGGASKAQGNPNARAWFFDHVIFEYDKKLYDASYGGNIHTSAGGNSVKKVWEHASLESHGFHVRIKEKIVDGEGIPQLKKIEDYMYKGTADVLNIQETLF
jgi:hypothetical protein